MRIAEYERLKLVANGLKSISTKSGFGFSKISDTTAKEYMSIAELHTGINSDKIEGIYPVATLDSVYVILVVYKEGYKIDAYSIDTIIGNVRPFDVRIAFASYDIFESLPALYKVLHRIMMPAPQDDVFYMYCFFNTFRGIYTHEDIASVAKSLAVTDDIPSIIDELINTHGINFVPDGSTIANAIGLSRKLKNTTTETK